MTSCRRRIPAGLVAASLACAGWSLGEPAADVPSLLPLSLVERSPTAAAGKAIEALDCETDDLCLLALCDPCNDPILDFQEVARSVTVTEGTLDQAFGTAECTIADVDVAVTLSHGRVGDLELALTAGVGSAASLYRPGPACTATEVDAVLDDEATAGPNGCPASGALQPFEPLSVFDGLDAVDTFTLHLFDDALADEGTLEALGLALRLQCEGPGEGTCLSGPTTLCLDGRRFEVGVEWSSSDFPAGPAFVSDLRTGSSGLFYFLDPDNLEFLVKVVDGCSFNDRYWVFFAATTDVEFTLRVTDTAAGETRTYTNPLGRPADAVTDTDAFATCP